MTEFRAVLAGTGVCVPPLEVDNPMLARIIETSDEWVRERSGIVTRYYVEPGVGVPRSPMPASAWTRSTTSSVPR
jgi:3-oxoacyl-[acyl-carrier-protein] synthase III